MKYTKLTVKISRNVLDRAERYARQNQTALSHLITEYLRQLNVENDVLTNAPIVQRLSGTLSQNVSVKDYRQRLESKHSNE